MRGRLIFIFWLSLSIKVSAQSDLSFYHLGNSTPQSSSFNPAYFPDARFYVSLPILSGFSIDANSAISYDEIFTDVANTDSVKIDFDNVLANLEPGDRLRTQGTISLFQLGFRVGSSSAFSLFVNDRYKMSAYYPKSVLNYFVQGNGSFLDETVQENYLSARGIYFREVGIGYVQEIDGFNGHKVKFGIRAKYLQGILQAQTNPNAGLELTTNGEDFGLTMKFAEPEILTAGLGMTSGDTVEYFLQNSNAGFGFDLGVDIAVSEKFSVALAANDIGKIHWSQGIQNYSLENTTIEIPNLDLDNLNDASTILSDTLSSLFAQNENSRSYSTTLNPRYVGSVRYQVFPKSTISTTFLAEKEFREYAFKYGMGFTQTFGKALSLSTTASYNDIYGFNVGGGLVTRLGFMQLYMTVDRFADLFRATDVAQVKSVNFRVGINFLFGSSERKEKKIKVKQEKVEESPFPDDYDLEHIRDIAD